jgi:hypothetical protein
MIAKRKELYRRLVAAQSRIGVKYASEGRGAIRRIDAIGKRWRNWAWKADLTTF